MVPNNNNNSKLKMKTIFFFCLVCTVAATTSNILFIGNSFTFVNDLPKTFRRLASAGGHPINTYFFGVGAASFQSLSKHPVLPSYLNLTKHWDYIILQEQSMFLALAPYMYRQCSIPYAKQLYTMIKNRTDHVILFETWAYLNGNPTLMTGLNDTYDKMQQRLSHGYNETRSVLLAMRSSDRDASVSVASVGQAWSVARKLPKFRNKLWQSDEMHPKPCGTYLAATVFFRHIFHQSALKTIKMKGCTIK